MTSYSGKTVKKGGKEVYDEVKLTNIPKFSDLKAEVNAIVKQCGWWDKYGVDWALNFLFLGLAGVGILFVRAHTVFGIVAGAFLMGWSHSLLATKAGHMATHGSFTEDKKWSRPLSVVFVEIIGTFSEELAYDIHIKEHHPYTNIIGIGDSSTWKVPSLPRYIYMFFAPLLLPPVTPLVSIAGLVEKRSFLGLAKYLIRGIGGLALQAYIVSACANITATQALLVLWLARAMFSISYIHVNIFQHIGLPMYSQENKPVRLYQMSTGVLNLPSNPILNYAFGHSIISCHVEHHLFPMLSDNMCLKIKPVVSSFLKKHGMPYNEKTYTNRLWHFIEKYDTLMVNAPPITHFVGLQ